MKDQRRMDFSKSRKSKELKNKILIKVLKGCLQKLHVILQITHDLITIILINTFFLFFLINKKLILRVKK